jgi:hypothetical protein
MTTSTIIKISSFTVIIISALAIGYIEPDYSLMTKANRATYVGIDNYDFKIDVVDGLYTETDVVGSVKDCSSERFPACITFGSTIITLPEPSYYKKADSVGYAEGVTEEKNLAFTIYPSSINVLGNEISGYRLTVGMDNMTHSIGRHVDGTYGSYFHSLDYGVLFFEDYQVVINPSDNSREMVAYTLWAKNECGLFSKNNCLKL